MVKVQGKSDYEKLDGLMARLTEAHGLRLDVTGWTRKTYDVSRSNDPRDRTIHLLARVESFVTTNGEFTIFDEEALPFAEELGAALEKEFGIEEATVIQRPQPS